MEENLTELIKNESLIETNAKIGLSQSNRPKTTKPKPVSGTKEWAAFSSNCLNGCSHDCKYCYAKATAVRFGHNTPQNWKNETLKPDILRKQFRNRDGQIFFPSSHDITPTHLDECMSFLENMLRPGNQVMIVTKPHLECVKAICSEFPGYRDLILFRFTIGSSNSNTLRFWEANAPDFSERLECLKFALSHGYQTSVSCEPVLDNNVGNLINQVSSFVTDSIWLGKANQLRTRLSLNGENDPVTIQRAKELIGWQSDGNIKQLYSQYQSNPLIKWKESIKKAVGLPITTKPGLDI